MLSKEVQPENVAALPSKSVSNLSNDFGILILLSDVQPLNAPQPIVITELGIIMLLREVQYSKAFESISVTEFGMTMLSRDLHKEKVP